MKFGVVAKMVGLAFFLVAVAASGVGLFSYYGYRQEMINQNIRLQGEEINIEASIKKSEIEELIKDNQFLANTPPVGGLARAIKNNDIDPRDGSSKQEWVSRLTQIFDNFLAVKKEYIKLELFLFSEYGDEVIRTKRLAGKIVNEDKTTQQEEWPQLMNVGSKALKGESTISKIELMREKGIVVEPHVPVIKTFRPLYSNDGALFGAMIVSMDLRPLFSELSAGESAGIHTHFITNDNGDYVYHPDPDMRFGFELGHRYRIQDQYPQFRKVLESSQGLESGQIIVSDNSQKMIMAYKKIRIDATPDDVFIMMVDVKPYSVALAGVTDVSTKISLLILALIVVGGVKAMLLVRQQIKPLETLKEAIVSFSEGKTDLALPTEREDEIGVLAIAFSNMTSQVIERNKEILKSEERFRQFAEHINDVFWVASADGISVYYVSPAFEQIWGVSCEALYQNQLLWQESIHPDDKEKVVGSDLMSRGLNSHSEEFRIVRPDGIEKWINNRAFVVRDEANEISRVIGVAKDITEDKQTERRLSHQNQELKEINDKLHEAQDQLLQSEKMASIGQLAAGVAHEINNPAGYVNSNLGSLKNYVEDLFKLLDKYEEHEIMLPVAEIETITNIKDEIEFKYLKDDVPNLISESLEGITRLKDIVQDLKDFSRVDEMEWQWADLHKGIESTLNIVNNELKYKASVVKEFADVPEVECIAAQINQVIMNVLVNAAHAIEEHGTISIKTGMNGDDWVWIKISDTGKGIAQENLRRIFDPFFTTKPIGQGTGLGMSLCYSIIEKHSGSIDVESELGKGTTFTINLPLKQQQKKADA